MIATFGFSEFARVSNSPNTARVAFFDKDRVPGNPKWPRGGRVMFGPLPE